MSGNPDSAMLLSMADKDFRALQGMIGSSFFSDEIFGFHAQQATEKTLKAWIALRGMQYPFTHDLSLLEHILEESGIDVSRWKCLLELGIFGVQFRYEALEPDEIPINREEIVSVVGELIETVRTAEE